MRRRAFFWLMGAAWLAGAVATLAWFRFTGSAALPASPATVNSLADSVRIEFDSLGIPVIRAASEPDAWRALGYMHASERLWQMDYFRRIASGRLSEVFGDRALQADRFARTLGLAEIARRGAESLDNAVEAALSAYAEGVNARLRADHPLPPEFTLLRYRPEEWTSASSLMVGLVMSLDLSHWRRDLSRHWAATHLEPALVDYLHPPYPDWGPRILDGQFAPPPGVAPVFQPDPGPAPDARFEPTAHGVPDTSRRSWDPFEVLASASLKVASNAWVVGPSRTASGNPILANDMHLALRAPSIWYVAAMQTPGDGLSVAGFTLPGVPGVVAGYNRHVAWGATNGMVDDIDYVVERLSEDGLRYFDDGRWADLLFRHDTIRVRGGAPVPHEVRSTHRGPLISDVLADVPGPLSAMFVSAGVDPGLGGLLDLNRAASVEEFHAAAAALRQPHLNLVAAATDGRIAYRLSGSVPLRTWDGARPVTGETVGDGWTGMWTPDEMPSVTEPIRDYLVTANNLQGSGLDGLIGADYPIPFRALRLTQALAVRRDWTIESTAALQRDVRSMLADRALGRAVAAARRTGDEGTAALLSGWDRRADVGSRAAPVFYTWFYGLRAAVAADEWSGAPSRSFFPVAAMLRVLEEGDDSPWVESLEALEDEAMREAVHRVDGRAWGELHTERHVHPLGRDALLERLFSFNVGPYPSDGGPHTVRPDAYQDWLALERGGPAPPWVSEYGPSERLVVELTPEGPVGWLAIPTGQSGNPFSPHYRDMLPGWRRGDLVRLDLERSEGPAQGPSLLLVPRGLPAR